MFENHPLAAAQDHRALLHGVLDVRLHLAHRVGVDQGALVGLTLTPVANRELLRLRREFRRKLLHHPLVHDEPLGAHARLTRVSKLAHDGAVHRGVDVGVGKHDERRVTAELK